MYSVPGNEWRLYRTYNPTELITEILSNLQNNAVEGYRWTDILTFTVFLGRAALFVGKKHSNTINWSDIFRCAKIQKLDRPAVPCYSLNIRQSLSREGFNWGSSRRTFIYRRCGLLPFRLHFCGNLR